MLGGEMQWRFLAAIFCQKQFDLEKMLGISSNFPVFAARCSGVSPLFVLPLIVTSESCDSGILDIFCVEARGCEENKVVGSPHIGHGIVCPVPSGGNSMCCPQCGHSHLMKSLISTCAVILRGKYASVNQRLKFLPPHPGPLLAWRGEGELFCGTISRRSPIASANTGLID